MIIKQAREMGLTMPTGGDGWDSAKLPEIVAGALNNTLPTITRLTTPGHQKPFLLTRIKRNTAKRLTPLPLFRTTLP